MPKGNVLINGRTAVHAGSKGTLSTVDVCLTKIGSSVVPIPYPNVAKSADADKTAATVFINGNPVCHKDSTFSKSTGDEPGDKKGIKSGTTGGKAEFITASSNVFIEDTPAVRQGDMMVSNNCNTPPMPLAQPGAAPARSLKARQAEELEASELPDRIDIGHIGEDTPLLKGRFQQSDTEESKDSKVHKRLSSYIDGDNPQRFRELVISNLEAGKQHRLTLVLNDDEIDPDAEEDKEYIVIPLGKTESVPKENPKPTKPDEYDNFMAPLVLKRYTTSDFDKSKAAELREGWIYIYLNGYLWRELQVSEKGFCNDVNLWRHQGEDFRKASGEADSRVIVPWKINNQKPTIEIAFSEVQWSWARINALGGMNPDTDFEQRLKSDTPLSKVSKSEAATRRSARMQDISDELNQWILSGGKETENIQMVDDVTAEIYTLQLNKLSKLPVVFLQDTLGIALDNAQAYQKAIQDLTDHVKEISEKPFYKSALLAYRLFFDPDRTTKKVNRFVGAAGYGTNMQVEEKNIFGKCGDKTDKKKLIDLLDVVNRQKMRVRIRELKKVHVEWLNGKVDGKAVTRSNFIHVNTAIIDYLSNEGYRYLQGWQAISGLIAGIDIDPCAIDGQLDLPQDKDRLSYERDPGCQYLKSVLQPSHPLHAAFFPSEQQVPVNSDDPIQKAEEENDGLGKFRVAAFIAALTGANRIPGLFSQEARRTAEFFGQTIQDIVSKFNKEWEDALKSQQTTKVKALTRLAKVSDKNLEGMRFISSKDMNKKYRILEAKTNLQRRIHNAAANKKLKASKVNPSEFLILDDADNVIASQNVRYLAKYKGIDISGNMDWTDVKNLKNRHLKINRVTEAGSELLVIPETSDLAWKLNNLEADMGATVEAKAKALRFLRKSLPPVVLVFEIWNLKAMVHELGYGVESSDAKRFGDLISATADLTYASLQGVTEILGEGNAVAQSIEGATFDIAGGALKTLPALGSIAAFGSAVLSLMDMVDNFDENDTDAAIGHGIAAAGFTLFGLGLLGASAEASGIALLASLGVFVPFTWAAFGIVLLGVVIAALFDNTPLEEWAANGPFCIGDGSDDYAYLRTNQELAYAALASCLYSPKIEMRRLDIPALRDDICRPSHVTKNDICIPSHVPKNEANRPNFIRGDLVVTVHLPKFEIGQDEVDVRACIQKPKYKGRSGIPGPQKPLEPYCVKQITEDGVNVIAIEYYYRDTSDHQSYQKRFTKWFAKARILTADGPILPEPKRREGTGKVIDPKGMIPEKPVRKDVESDEDFQIREDAYQKQLNIINEDVTGWVYADLHYKEM